MSAVNSININNNFSGIFASLMEGFRLRKAVRETRKSLNSLSDRELNDIGLTRDMIPEVAYRSLHP